MSFSGNVMLLLLVLTPIVAAMISFIIGRQSKLWRDYFACFVFVCVFVWMLLLSLGANNQSPPYFEWQAFAGFGISFTLDGFRAVYATITAFMWLATTLFSREYFADYRNRNRYYMFSLLTFGGTLGVFLSADLITTFIFFEIASFASYVLVIHDEKKETIQAARTYIAVVVIGGLALLFGTLLLAHLLGTTEISALYAAAQAYDGSMGLLYLAGAFMLIGFGGKAGMFPLHIWLPSAHPVAPAPASALLSGILTKIGVFGVIILSTSIFRQDFTWGMILLNLGLVGMVLGAALAVFSTNLKRTLAFSSVSQIGFILLGIGMTGILTDSYYGSLATTGTFLHMMNHSLVKLLLFMMAGVVVINLHELDLNKIRGFGRGKPLFIFCFLMGGLTLIGMPFISGYISKTLLHDSLVYYIWLFESPSALSTYFRVIEGVFTLTGGLTTAYVLKLFICLCIEKPQNLVETSKKYVSNLGAVVLLICAVILPVLGFSPYLFMMPIADFGQTFFRWSYPTYVLEFFTLMPLRGAFASILIGCIIYTLIVRISLMAKSKAGPPTYIDAWPSVLNMETLIYRPLFTQILPFIGTLFSRAVSSFLPTVTDLGYRAFLFLQKVWRRMDERIYKPLFTQILPFIVVLLSKAVSSFLPAITTIVHRIFSFFRRLSHERNKKIAALIARNEKLDERQKNEFATVDWLAGVFNIHLNGTFTRVIFGSLAYSMLVFFIGFVIVQVIIFTRM